MAREGRQTGDEEYRAGSIDRPDDFVAFYEEHAEGVLRFFVRRTLDAQAAADLTAETFAEAFASRTRYHDLGSGPEGWLYTIARRQLSHFIRRRRIDDRARKRLGMPMRELEPDDHERIEELIDFEAAGRAVARAFGQLSKRQRAALTLRVLEGRPYPDVARLLSCTEQTARTRVSRGLRRMAAIMEEEA